jgi:hypothetical protein
MRKEELTPPTVTLVVKSSPEPLMVTIVRKGPLVGANPLMVGPLAKAARGKARAPSVKPDSSATASANATCGRATLAHAPLPLNPRISPPSTSLPFPSLESLLWATW